MDLGYDIEQMFIDGASPSTIAKALECHIEVVNSWLKDNGLVNLDNNLVDQTINML